jgi:hypothetical protein
MMKTLAVIACSSVAIDCVERALGTQTQSLFSESAIWMWWVAAASWAIGGIAMIFCRVEGPL